MLRKTCRGSLASASHWAWEKSHRHQNAQGHQNYALKESKNSAGDPVQAAQPNQLESLGQNCANNGNRHHQQRNQNESNSVGNVASMRDQGISSAATMP
jgi:hypothetical protein